MNRANTVFQPSLFLLYGAVRSIRHPRKRPRPLPQSKPTLSVLLRYKHHHRCDLNHGPVSPSSYFLRSWFDNLYHVRDLSLNFDNLPGYLFCCPLFTFCHQKIYLSSLLKMAPCLKHFCLPCMIESNLPYLDELILTLTENAMKIPSFLPGWHPIRSPLWKYMLYFEFYVYFLEIKNN